MKCGVGDFGLPIMCHFIWFGGIWAVFPKLPYCSNTLKTNITEPSDDLGIRVRSHLMLNEELMSLNYFSFCFCAWFGVFEPSFPKLAQYRSTCETGITQSTEALDTRVRSHLKINKKLKTLDYFSCVPARDLGHLGPVFPNFPNTRVPVKQV